MFQMPHTLQFLLLREVSYAQKLLCHRKERPHFHLSFSSRLCLKTYRDSSSCRPNGCRAQGVSKSGSDFGPRQRSVATVASDQTWTNQKETPKLRSVRTGTGSMKEPHLSLPTPRPYYSHSQKIQNFRAHSRPTESELEF